MKSLTELLPQAVQANKELTASKIGSIVDTDKQIEESFEGEKLISIDVSTLKSTLAYIFQLIGLTKLPEKEEFLVIEDFIRSTYPNFTINEFRLAFKLAVQRKLDCDIEHYEKFSPKYISQIMSAYKGKAVEVRKYMSYRPVKEIPAPQLTDNEIVKFTQDAWLDSDKKDFNKVWNADKVFRILYSQGKIKLSNTFIDETIKIVKADNAERLSKMNIYDAKEFAAKCRNEFFIEEQCKKLAIVRYFENISNQI
jgi:hypothetical protein